MRCGHERLGYRAVSDVLDRAAADLRDLAGVVAVRIGSGDWTETPELVTGIAAEANRKGQAE
jgi:hypothetical protein